MTNEENFTKDIEILRDGPICLYFKNEVLEEDLGWFADNGFVTSEMNCRNWTRKNAHQHLKAALNFPDYYGENLDAFADCLSDRYNSNYKGLILVFRRYDAFVEEDGKFAEAILDIIAKESRLWLLTGQKLICLVQSDNPHLHFPALGHIRPNWNAKEWLNESRQK